MKKILALLGTISLFLGISVVYGQLSTSIGDTEFNSTNTNLYSVQNNSEEIADINISTLGTQGNQNGNIIDVIKRAINRVLGMLSLIALVLCLWGGFQIVTAAGDDTKQKKGMSVLKHAAFGLIVIGLAWFIVTIVFWLLRGVAGQ